MVYWDLSFFQDQKNFDTKKSEKHNCMVSHKSSHLWAHDTEFTNHTLPHIHTCVRVDYLHIGVWDGDARRI